jgi:hypothetical protein
MEHDAPKTDFLRKNIGRHGVPTCILYVIMRYLALMFFQIQSSPNACRVSMWLDKPSISHIHQGPSVPPSHKKKASGTSGCLISLHQDHISIQLGDGCI